MNKLLEGIIAYKKDFVKTIKTQGQRTRKIYRLKDAVKKDKINVIAEIKSSSPSAGFIKDINLDEIVPYYARYASAISVLTDDKFFGGSFERLRNVADMVEMPVLCKDFIIDKIQIDKAYECGADMVLLIVRILDEDKFVELFSYAESLGLDVLAEVHTKDEANFALKCGCSIIGVNSRDLDTLEISLKRAADILDMLDRNVIRIAESGIKTKNDIEYLKEKCDAFLIGEGLLKGELELSEIAR